MSNTDNENLVEKFNKVLNTAKDAIGQIQEAIVETDEAAKSQESIKFKCLNNRIMNFELLEEDVIRIHEKLKHENYVVLGTYLIINLATNGYKVLLESYLQKDNENFRESNKIEVVRIQNLPSDIAYELKQDGEVKLHLEV
jgi:hypothetical protein